MGAVPRVERLQEREGTESGSLSAGDMVNKLQSLGLLVPPAGENVVRVFPALIAEKATLDEGVDILSKAAQSFEAGAKAA